MDVAPWLAQVTGAAVGALVLIEVVGWLLASPDRSPVGWFHATATTVAQAYLDLTWRHQISTTQYGHFCLVIGIVVWGTAQAASYDVFGYHRAINGVLLTAVVLMANMSLTRQDQFQALVLFSAAALALLLRAHSADERTSWQRHRIWRGGDVRGPRSQSGYGFATAAIAGALILTTVASSAPLANAWTEDNFRQFTSWFNGFLPQGAGSRISLGSDFGSSTVLSTSFSASSDTVFTINELTQNAFNPHWRVVSYDQFKSTGWSAGDGTQTGIDAGAGLNDGTLDQIGKDTSARTAYSYTIHVKDTSLRHLVIASEPSTASVSVNRIVVGTTSDDSDIVWFPSDATTYTVNSLVPNLDPKGAGLTEWRLRQAGTDYPPVLLDRYTQGADTVGTAGRRLLSQIEVWAKANKLGIDAKTGHFLDAYDAAKAVQEYMRNSANFTYDSNISDLVPKCSTLTTVDCFATYKRGFCEQYATTMTMLMRLEGYPARFVEGYLSGEVDQATRAVKVTGQQRHAWVEVYFPNYGWIPFDPTGGSVGQPTELPAGTQANATPTPLVSAGPDSTGPDKPIKPVSGGSTSNGSGGGPLGGLLLPGGVALVGGLIFFLVWRRRPRRLESPDAVYRGIVRVASRLGYKPLPTQTVYEYTGMLADIVPHARDPLGEVATAQVEVVYGRRRMSATRLVTLAAAQRRVRQALLRLVFRIPGRRPKQPPKGRAGRR
jgi:transglutaminase-like putative cysteine protease